MIKTTNLIAPDLPINKVTAKMYWLLQRRMNIYRESTFMPL